MDYVSFLLPIYIYINLVKSRRTIFNSFVAETKEKNIFSPVCHKLFRGNIVCRDVYLFSSILFIPTVKSAT